MLIFPAAWSFSTTDPLTGTLAATVRSVAEKLRTAWVENAAEVHRLRARPCIKRKSMRRFAQDDASAGVTKNTLNSLSGGLTKKPNR